MKSNLRPVLYIEDDENDVFLMETVWKNLDLRSPLEIARDGKEALEYFSAKTQTDANPSFVLLDLNLPGRPGWDVLKWIRQQPRFCTLPVLVFSASQRDEDIHRAYRGGANAYLVKPLQAEHWRQMIETLREFWLHRNQSPPDPREFDKSSPS